MGERRDSKTTMMFYPQRVCSLIYMESTWSCQPDMAIQISEGKAGCSRDVKEDGSQKVNSSLNKSVKVMAMQRKGNTGVQSVKDVQLSDLTKWL